MDNCHFDVVELDFLLLLPELLVPLLELLPEPLPEDLALNVELLPELRESVR